MNDNLCSYVNWRWMIPSYIVTIMLILTTIIFPQNNRAATDSFDYETVISGTIANSANKLSEDSNYESLIELDTDIDENYTTSVETVVLGIAGGDALPASISSDDNSFRTYQEQNTKASNYFVWIFPDGDTSATFATIFPATP